MVTKTMLEQFGMRLNEQDTIQKCSLYKHKHALHTFTRRQGGVAISLSAYLRRLYGGEGLVSFYLPLI